MFANRPRLLLLLYLVCQDMIAKHGGEALSILHVSAVQPEITAPSSGNTIFQRVTLMAVSS